MRKLIVLLVLALALGGAAACGRDKAPDSTPNAASETTTDNPEEKMRAFAQCMRDHGVEMEDPEVITDGNGGTRTKVRIGGPSGAPNGAGGPGPGDERFKQAEQECRHLMPKGGDLGKAPSPEDEENMRNFAKCMRENGVENFPDPQPGGGIAISKDDGINPEDPAFQEAEKKCEELMPRRGEKVTS
jgi:predicted small lipoprotein YifL